MSINSVYYPFHDVVTNSGLVALRNDVFNASSDVSVSWEAESKKLRMVEL